MADKDFVVKNGIVVSGNLTLSNTSGIIANGSPGSIGQVLTTNGSAAYWSTVSGGGGGGSSFIFTASATPPSTPAAGDEWLDTDNGIVYKYFNDGTSAQWVEFGPATISPPANLNLDGGTPTSIYGGLTAIDAGGVT